MPITIEALTSTVLSGPAESNASSNLQQDLAESEHNVLQTGDLEDTGDLLLYQFFLESLGPLALDSSPEREVGVVQTSIFRDEFFNLNLEDFEFVQDVFLSLVPGDVPAFQSDLNTLVVINTIDVFNRHLQNVPLFLIDKGADSFQVINLQPNEEVSASGGLTLEDVIGPVIRNELPPSGSRLNNPATEITFDLEDDAIGIRDSSIEFVINGILVVSSGVVVSTPGFGQTFLTKVSDNLFEFRFIKDTPFELHETVTISGFAEDEEIPANSGFFSYEFVTWDYRDLGGEIIGGDDVLPPYLTNQLPAPGQIQVDPNFNINLQIGDLHTGVDPDSVSISVDGNLVVESGSVVTDFAVTTISAVPGIRGYGYTVNPNETLPFFNNTLVEVYATDLFVISGSPNVLDASYSFLTTSNQHLVISGLQVIEDTVYEDFTLQTSFKSSEPTDFRIIYRDLSLSGIDVSNSFVYHNEVEVSGVTFTEVVSGSNDAYFVDFELEPYYEGESILRFRATQVFSGAVSGTIAPYRDVISTLQWGYEICYDPEEDLDHDDYINYCVRLCDKGDFPSLGAFCTDFETRPLFSRQLSAKITGIELDPNTLLTGIYTSNNTFFEYGKTMQLEIEVADFEGNVLIFPWEFTIEEES